MPRFLKTGFPGLVMAALALLAAPVPPATARSGADSPPASAALSAVEASPDNAPVVGWGRTLVVYRLSLEFARARERALARLHGHIEDLFNENGVQTMSPHYENQPAAPILVLKDRWHPPASDGGTEPSSKGSHP